MYTEFCQKLGLDVPIFAFSHCRDVVVAVSKSGGLGVLGAGDTQKVAMNICGQVIGQINHIESSRNVIYRLISEYLEALEVVNNLMPDS